METQRVTQSVRCFAYWKHETWKLARELRGHYAALCYITKLIAVTKGTNNAWFTTRLVNSIEFSNKQHFKSKSNVLIKFTMINKRYFGAQNLLFLVKLFYVFEFRCAWSKTLVFIWWFVRAQSPNRKRRPLVIFVHTCAQIPLQNSPNRAWERKLMKCYVSSMDNHDFCFVSFEGRDQLNFKLCYGRLNWLIFFENKMKLGSRVSVLSDPPRELECVPSPFL